LSRKKKLYSDKNRRRWPRLAPSAVPHLKSVSFSQGPEAQVVNISRGGILLETEIRLRPFMKILLRIVTSRGVFKMEGSVVRSYICSLKDAPRYHSAVAFDHPFNLLEDVSEKPEKQSGTSQFKPNTAETVHGNGDHSVKPPDFDNPRSEDNHAILTVKAKEGSSIQEMMGLNNW
jgi:hypothetical protein